MKFLLNPSVLQGEYYPSEHTLCGENGLIC